MNRENLEKMIQKLDALIATLQQAVVFSGRSEKETRAVGLLKRPGCCCWWWRKWRLRRQYD